MSDETAAANVLVAVRVRPFNAKEKDQSAKCCVRMNGNSTILLPAKNLEAKDNDPESKSFNFDYSYWSFDSRPGVKAPNGIITQEEVYADLGRLVVKNAYDGFNCTLMAYGQTGSGKSYTMMGAGGVDSHDRGVIPRVCNALFDPEVAGVPFPPLKQGETVSFKIEVSYLEIYAERIRDLLAPKTVAARGNMPSLRIREHPQTGPYVEDLTRNAVNSYDELLELMTIGNKERTVAATNMNSESSRSHAVFTVVYTQTRNDEMTGLSSDIVSKIQLVDLAGSERADASGAEGQRLKEASNINKSLSTLGLVISALAKRAESAEKGTLRKNTVTPPPVSSQASSSKLIAARDKRGSSKFTAPVVPEPKIVKPGSEYIHFRDSTLTWLLKDSLGGNSKTIMICTISPSVIHYNETLSTLRFAARAKQVQNRPVVNEDPNAKIIRALRSEIEELQKQLQNPQNQSAEVSRLREQLDQSQKIISQMNQTWAERLDAAKRLMSERIQNFKKQGIAVEKSADGMPFLVNLNEDPSMSESLIYYVRPGYTYVGREEYNGPPPSELEEKTGTTSPGHQRRVTLSITRALNAGDDDTDIEDALEEKEESDMASIIEGGDSDSDDEDKKTFTTTVILRGEGIRRQHCVITHTDGQVWITPFIYELDHKRRNTTLRAQPPAFVKDIIAKANAELAAEKEQEAQAKADKPSTPRRVPPPVSRQLTVAEMIEQQTREASGQPASTPQRTPATADAPPVLQLTPAPVRKQSDKKAADTPLSPRGRAGTEVREGSTPLAPSRLAAGGDDSDADSDEEPEKGVQQHIAELYVNGELISEARLLTHGDRIILGSNHVFRFSQPRTQDDYSDVNSLVRAKGKGDSSDPTPARVASGGAAAKPAAPVDYNFAINERLGVQQKLHTLLSKVDESKAAQDQLTAEVRRLEEEKKQQEREYQRLLERVREMEASHSRDKRSHTLDAQQIREVNEYMKGLSAQPDPTAAAPASAAGPSTSPTPQSPHSQGSQDQPSTTASQPNSLSPTPSDQSNSNRGPSPAPTSPHSTTNTLPRPSNAAPSSIVTPAPIRVGSGADPLSSSLAYPPGYTRGSDAFSVMSRNPRGTMAGGDDEMDGNEDFASEEAALQSFMKSEEDERKRLAADRPRRTEGYLIKRGGFIPNWKNRYFVIQGQEMVYFSDKEQVTFGTPKGSFKLPGAKLLNYTFETWKKNHCFGLQPAGSSRIFVMVAASELELSEWLDSIRRIADPEGATAPFVREDPSSLKLVPNSIKEGYIMKRGDLIKSWKVRYFVLTSRALIYYKHKKKDAQPIKAIPLDGAVVKVELSDAYNRAHAFSVTPANSDRVYVNVAANGKELQAWMQAIDSVISDLNGAGSIRRSTRSGSVSGLPGRSNSILSIASTMTSSERYDS